MAKTIPTDDSPRTEKEATELREYNQYSCDAHEIGLQVLHKPGDPRRPFFDFLSREEQNEIIQQYCGCDADQVGVEVLVAARQSFDLSTA